MEKWLKDQPIKENRPASFSAHKRKSGEKIQPVNGKQPG